MSPRRRNERNNSPWSSKRSRSRSYSPSTRRYRRSPRNESRKRSRERDNKYSKRDQSNNYRSAYISSKAISSSTIQPPVPPPPTVHSISASAYNTVPEPDYKSYGGYNQYNTIQPDYNQATITPQFNMAYPPPPSWSTTTPDIMAAPPPWPVAPPVPTPVHQMQPVQPPAPPVNKDNIYETATREAAVAQEIQNQREELKKQRNDYLRKSDTMKKELKMLKEQMVDLVGGGDAPPSPTTKRYIDENEKLQGQIQKKISTIENVLDMLNGIIGEEEKKENVSEKPKSESSDSTASSSSSSSSSESDDDSSPERLKTKVIESMKSRKESLKIEEKKKDKRENNGVSDSKFNYVFYDPEMNWCKVCNVFPKSAKDYLNHMHSKEHIDKVDVPPTPWHDDFHSDEFPHIEHSQTKRVPIRGLQFFVPSRAWFCKLCKVWMGDLHCASLHLKSRTHSSKYDEFFQKNLTFEVEWMAERQKALGKVGRSPSTGKLSQTENVFDNIPLKLGGIKNSEDKHSKSKKSESKKSKSKKKRSKKHKKGSSSSTSNSSSSESESGMGADYNASSIRVTMRNIKKPEDDMKDDLTSKGGYNPMEIDEIEKKKDELMMTQWNTPQPIISESEKKLLEQLKGKLKNKPQEEPVKKEVEPKKSVNRDHIRKRSPGPKERSPVSRNRSNRSRSRDRWRGIRSDRRSRSINRYNRRSRDRDRDRDRRSRSRDRDNRRSRSRRRNGSRNRSPYHWRGSRRSISRDRRRWSTSKSKSKSRSRSSSTSRRSNRVEKPLVRYPEFRPRISENESKRKSDREKKLAGTTEEEGDRKKSPNSSNSSSKKSSAATSSYAGGKKLPFIGRMPVLAKKQQEQNNENNSTDLNDDMMNSMGDSKSMENNYANFDNDGVYYDDLMPDPMQYASIMGAPPPPPPPMHVIDDKDMLPPGIDEMETEFVPKPISEAPAPRKGPLPRDFEEALNIIFPDEVKVITDNKMDLPLEMNTQLQPPDMDSPLQPSEILPEEVESTPFILQSVEVESAVTETSVIEEEIITDPIEIELHHIEMPPPIELPPPIEIPLTTEKSTVLDDPVIDEFIIQSSNNPETVLSSTTPTTTTIIEDTTLIALPEETLPIIDTSQENNNHSSQILDTAETKESSSIPAPNSKQKEWRPEELDDLAMLGIDADDLAAQCI